MKHEFWKSAGLHLLKRNDDGWLQITPDFLRAYYTRPEVHPVEESCPLEIELHDALMADPFMDVDKARLQALADKDALETYRIILGFRDVLVGTGTIEGAYLDLFRGKADPVPPVFLDQLVHLILRNCLEAAADPMRLRAGELFFREQNVSTDDGRVMLADKEIVEMHSQRKNESGLGQLLSATGTPQKTIELDVLSDDNAQVYWQRSDRFDTVIDFRFEQPAPDALARVIEAWLAHMLKLEVNVQPMIKIEDRDWQWHIGLDREATKLLNKLFDGGALSSEEGDRIVGLFQMRIKEESHVIDRVQGRPIYLGLAMTPAGLIKMKPQNLLMNLPLRAAA